MAHQRMGCQRLHIQLSRRYMRIAFVNWFTFLRGVYLRRSSERHKSLQVGQLEAFGAKECSALRCFSWIPVIPLPILRLQQLTRHAGALVVNEIAPRPHNSGHYTIEACPTFSQYKSQLLSILGFMPRFPNSVIPAMFPATIMLNILGGASKDSHNQLMKRAIAIPNAALHMYGKESKPARKIGHITVVANSMSEGISSFPSATNVCKTLVFH